MKKLFIPLAIKLLLLTAVVVAVHSQQINSVQNTTKADSLTVQSPTNVEINSSNQTNKLSEDEVFEQKVLIQLGVTSKSYYQFFRKEIPYLPNQTAVVVFELTEIENNDGKLLKLDTILDSEMATYRFNQYILITNTTTAEISEKNKCAIEKYSHYPETEVTFDFSPFYLDENTRGFGVITNFDQSHTFRHPDITYYKDIYVCVNDSLVNVLNITNYSKIGEYLEVQYDQMSYYESKIMKFIKNKSGYNDIILRTKSTEETVLKEGGDWVTTEKKTRKYRLVYDKQQRKYNTEKLNKE